MTGVEHEPVGPEESVELVGPDDLDELLDEGLSDAELVLSALLTDLGLPADEVARATEEGTLHLLALERLLALEAAVHTLDEVSVATGLPADVVLAFWRALGFPEPPPGEPVFSDHDLELLSVVLPFISEGGVDHASALQMARVIGASLSKIATAQIEAIARAVSGLAAEDLDERAEGAGDGVDGGGLGGDESRTDEDLAAEQLVSAARRAAELLPAMPRLMEFVWRRHLGLAARRRIIRATNEEETDEVCVGFADLVGFTATTQELPEDELAHIVERFETIAYDCVAAHGGRIVKTIGDEVMFITDDVRTGGELALDLAAQYRADPDLSDVRVGLAAGRVLERDGDVYGPVVNLASRIVAIAFPGSVVVGPEVAGALAEDPTFTLRSIRSHYLKDIGRVRLWTMRAATGEGDDDAELDSGARSRRAARRRFVLERRRRQREEALERAGQIAPELAVHDVLADEASEDEATTGEYAALTDAVLSADLDEETQVELLADIGAAQRLQDLEEQAQALAVEADEEAERRIEQIEEEARRRIEEIEAEKRRLVDSVLTAAEERARRANEQASRRLKKVADEVERRAERAERDALRDAKRLAAQARADREKAEAEEARRAEEAEQAERAEAAERAEKADQAEQVAGEPAGRDEAEDRTDRRRSDDRRERGERRLRRSRRSSGAGSDDATDDAGDGASSDGRS